MPVIERMKVNPGAATLGCQCGNQLRLYKRYVGASVDDEDRKARSGKRIPPYLGNVARRHASRKPQRRFGAGARRDSTSTGTRKPGVRIVGPVFQPGYKVDQRIQAIRDAGGILLRVIRRIETPIRV